METTTVIGSGITITAIIMRMMTTDGALHITALMRAVEPAARMALTVEIRYHALIADSDRMAASEGTDRSSLRRDSRRLLDALGAPA
jgi:hypothetical protein